jgi:regulator of sigma E protease
MTLLNYAGSFLVALCTLIIVHEFGHYIVARLCGVKVLRFSVGFGKPLILKRLGRDQTEWVVASFPLGGFVKMLDEREGEVPAAQLHRAFNRQSVYKRFAIVLAGPVANFILAIFVYWLLFMHGVPGSRPVVDAPGANTPAAIAQFQAGDTIASVGDVPVRTWEEVRLVLLKSAVAHRTVEVGVRTDSGVYALRKLDLSGMRADQVNSDFLDVVGLAPMKGNLRPVIETIQPGSAAQRAGLEPGERILSVGGVAVNTWDELVKAVRARPGTPTEVVVRKSNGEQSKLTLTPDTANENGQTFGRIGVGPFIEVQYGPASALWHATKKTWDMSAFTVEMMGRMIIGEVSLKNLSGPITIADYAGQSAKMGWMAYVTFIAVISISLGVLNLLPVPILDGGHLMYYIAEIIRGRPVSERALELGQRIGMVVLFSLMAFAIYNDIYRLVSG